MPDTQGDQPAGVNVNNCLGRPSLTGWERIEDHYKDLDQNMVDGFKNDIDTLLVFAGLFSAVLTAFLMQSNTLLRVDNSQTTVELLAQLVALQMGNSSNHSAVQPTPFTPSSPSVLINTLWYLSLVLSLASALFGMMAKQWLREYMQWTIMSTLPADAVFLRQLRYEAFVDWKTPGILACIPVLLEVAVILFFVGMVVHLFTLNAIVADVCTAAVAITLTLTILSLILPVSFPRCPYKSPAGWSLLLLMRSWTSLWDMLRFRMSFISEAWSNPSTRRVQFFMRLSARADQPPVKDWRTRDVELQRRDGIVREIPRFYADGSLVPSDLRQLSREATRMYALFGALLWIHETSQDGQLLATVNECYKMRNSPCIQANHPIDVLILDYVVVCDRLHVPVYAMRVYLHAIHRDDFGMNPLAEFQVTQDSALRHGVFAKIIGAPSLVKIVLGNILSVTVFQSLSHLHPGAITDPAQTTPLFVNQLLLCGRIIPLEYSSSAQIQDVHRASMANFKYIFDLLSMNKELCQKLPGIRSILLHFMFKWEERGLTKFTLISGAVQSSRYNAYVTDPCQILAGDPSEWMHDDCDVFIRVSSRMLQKAWPEDAPPSHLCELLACMKQCVEVSIERNWKNCGSYCLLNPWTAGPDSPLYRLFHPRGERYIPEMDQIYPHVLIDALRRCSAGPLQGRSAALQALIARSAELLRCT
ncbi:hypothetical protein OG21DRAFT_1487242 [Imleria badia]|nr:hypothetical protein OG21DRAFT_1487242 [Imleria badia]